MLRTACVMERDAGVPGQARPVFEREIVFLELGLWAAWGMYTEWGGAPSAGVVTGITITARQPSFCAASATPCAWLPALAAITPRLSCSGVKWAAMDCGSRRAEVGRMASWASWAFLALDT